MKWLVFLCAAVGILGFAWAGSIQAPPIPVTAELGASRGGSPDVRMLVVPTAGGAVVVRALSEAEWASYQVRAESWQWIEAQMLAAAVVLPPITAAEASALPPDLARALRAAVNEASGFAVFADGLER
jgi:hypothetical protein